MAKKISVDEILSKRKDLRGGTASIVKAVKTPSSWDKQNRTANFVMNAQAKDLYGDIVVTAGIDTSDFEKNPVALLFHNSRTWPVGTWSDLQKITSGRPPRLEGKLNLLPEGGPVKEIDECAWMIANGGVRGCSIGFMPDWDNYELILDEEGTWQGGIRFLASKLLEASVCSLPASPQSLVKDAPSMQVARDFIEDILENYTKTPEGLILPRSEYEAAHKEISGNPTTVVVEKSEDVGADDVSEVAKAIDETEGLPEETRQTLISRGMVFATEVKSDEKTFAGYVIAKSHENAEAIVAERGSGEKILGELTEEREVEPEAADIGRVLVKLDVDSNIAETKQQLEDLEATIDRVEKRAEGVFARVAKFFGTGSFKDGGIVSPERKDPELTIEPEIKAAPTEDEIAAAKTRAVAIRERLTAKGMIAAE